MFQSARLKLTAWYLLIIMIISGIFSLIIYSGINQELNQFERMQKMRQEREESLSPYFEEFRRQRQLQGRPVPPTPESELAAIASARSRLKLIFVLINLGILGVAGIAGYFLAGRTLKPIQLMVDDQNRFITDASHELRTPLTSLKSEIEVALRDKKLKLSDAKTILQSNLEEVNNLSYLSDNLIKLAQNHRINNNHSLQKTSLKNISEEALKKVSKLASAKNIKIESQMVDLNILADKQSLTELLVILIDNAIKYSDSNTKIVVSSKIYDHTVSIKIKDQGIGIHQDEIEHLFDRFYRADKARTKKDASGYGLGLSIAKQIVDNHKGTIKVESKVEKGSTFIIRLPIS